MTIFIELVVKLTPLYVLIPLGYVAGKFLKADKKTLAVILIYIVASFVVFDGALRANLDLESFTLPLTVYVLSCLFCCGTYFFSRFFWKDSTRNILAFLAGTWNNGYFGLPVALILFGENILGAYVLALFASILYENTIGFFIVNRAEYRPRESLFRMLRLPTVYAFVLGLAFNAWGIELGGQYDVIASSFRWTYTILGMMIIGVALAWDNKKAFDPIFVGTTFFIKFFLWPVIVLFVIFVDKHYLWILSEEGYQVLVLFSIVPLAAKTVALASLCNAQPEKASLAVLWSTVFAVIYIPLFIAFFL